MVGCRVHLKKRKSEWLSTLLCCKFFGACVDHWNVRKNEKNMFCIDCNFCFCKHCITSSAHCLHRWLQICKYVYHDVVRLQDIQKHLDCYGIQTYKINGEKAVHLNPRPQLKDTKTLKSKGGASCEACGRYIQDLPNCFCSIACKVSVVPEMFINQKKKMISIPVSDFDYLSFRDNDDPEEKAFDAKSYFSLTESSEESRASAWLTTALKPKKQLHKRKGIPQRAPLS